MYTPDQLRWWFIAFQKHKIAKSKRFWNFIYKDKVHKRELEPMTELQIDELIVLADLVSIIDYNRKLLASDVVVNKSYEDGRTQIGPRRTAYDLNKYSSWDDFEDKDNDVLQIVWNTYCGSAFAFILNREIRGMITNQLRRDGIKRDRYTEIKTGQYSYYVQDFQYPNVFAPMYTEPIRLQRG